MVYCSRRRQLVRRSLADFAFLVLILGVCVQAQDFFPFDNDLASTVRRDKNAKFVAFGARHGNRNPGRLLKEAKGIYGFEGPYELTAFGKRQAYTFGRELRTFAHGFINGNYVPNEAVFYSSSANRAQMTLQIALAGLYPPRSYALWNLALDWSPVPYRIDNPMLRMNNVTCPESVTAWQPINEASLPELALIVKENEALLQYMHEHTGWKPTLDAVADLADNINQFEIHNATLPMWIESGNLTGFEDDVMIDLFRKFEELPQLQCVQYEPCRHLMSGVWLQKLGDLLEAVVNDTENSPKLVGFVSHTEIVLSLMTALDLDLDHLDTTAGFILEVRDKPAWEARILHHFPVFADQHVIAAAVYGDDLRNMTSVDDWIPVSDLLSLIRAKEISNWPVTCGIEKQDDQNVPSNTDELIANVLEVARSEKSHLNSASSAFLPGAFVLLFPYLTHIFANR